MKIKKAGRPFSENSMKSRITVRLNKECEEILCKYCLKKGVTKNEAVRRGIMELKKTA